MTVDNHAGGVSAAAALFDQGFRRVACITGPRDVETAQLRSAGWREIAAQRSTDSDLDDLLVYANYRVDGGAEAMKKLLALPNRPDAVVVANNLMGVGALGALAEAGITPPAFGMAVFGDLAIAPLSPQGITVVHLPSRQLGVTAASLLMERIGGDTQPPRTIVLRNSPS